MKSEIATFAQVFPDTTLWNPDLLEEGTTWWGSAGLRDADQRNGNCARLEAAPRSRRRSRGDAGLRGVHPVDVCGPRGEISRRCSPDAEINREKHLRLQYLAGLAANTDQRF